MREQNNLKIISPNSLLSAVFESPTSRSTLWVGRRDGRAGGSCRHSCSSLTHTQVPRRSCRVWRHFLTTGVGVTTVAQGGGKGWPAPVLFLCRPWGKHSPCHWEQLGWHDSGCLRPYRVCLPGLSGSWARCPSAEHHQPRAFLCWWGTAKPPQ